MMKSFSALGMIAAATLFASLITGEIAVVVSRGYARWCPYWHAGACRRWY
jgi:hypothetical protein